jgi:hypothetical protein
MLHRDLNCRQRHTGAHVQQQIVGAIKPVGVRRRFGGVHRKHSGAAFDQFADEGVEIGSL